MTVEYQDKLDKIKKAFPELAKRFDISELSGMLAFTKEVWPGFLYAQNGLRFELRWDISYPPVHLQQGKVVERLAEQIIHWLDMGDLESESKKIHVPFEDEGHGELDEDEVSEELAEEMRIQELVGDDLADEELEAMALEEDESEEDPGLPELPPES